MLNKLFIVSFISLVLSACGNMESRTLAESEGGLVATANPQYDRFYLLPGADIGRYKSIAIEPCEVSFRKHWLRDQNSVRAELNNRVTQEDVDRILAGIASSCDEKFQQEIVESTVYTLVDDSEAGDGVLLLRPRIIELDVHAPDVKGAGFVRSFSRYAGDMTLSMEWVDGTTGKLLARAIDKTRDIDSGRAKSANSVTNKADFDRVIRRWATKLPKGLEQAAKN